MNVQPFEQVEFKHSDNLMYKYRQLNHNWERWEIGNEIDKDYNFNFVKTLSQDTELVKKEILKYLQVYDKTILASILKELCFAVERNIKIYKEKETIINEVHKNSFHNWYKIIYEHSFYILKIELKDYYNIEIDNKKLNKNIKLPTKTDMYNTVLTRKQISLLAYFLRENKFILKNTSNTLLADCFGKMTGYSTTQINKDYKGMTDVIDISDNKKDYETIIENLNKLVLKIKDYKEKNEKNKNIK